MNYSEMSSAEINRRVALVVYPGDQAITPYSHREDVQIFHKNDCYTFKDFCNSWADAGPIIAEQQISIIFDADSTIDPPAHWVLCRHVDSNGRVSEHYGQPTAPLRSAMIVFLMMQEDKCKS